MLPSNDPSRTPAYDLEEVQRLVGQGPISRRITKVAADGAVEVGLSEEGLVAAVLSLTPAHFYKCMEAEQRPGLWQDVYHLPHGTITLYLKLQIGFDGRAVVVQCKRR
jgi:hypothetical protein